MAVPHTSHLRLELGAAPAVLAATAGAVSLFGTYWDDAWHTDRGRDSAWAPPHLALYGGVALVGLLIAWWAVRTLVATRSLRQTLCSWPLVLAGVAGAVVLGAAPADAWWHTAFGRDAVLWSPPHILIVFASTALIVGLLAGIASTVPSLWRAAVGAILIGDLLVAVMEYDTDVPQFSAWWYLPVFLLGGLFAAELLRRLNQPSRWPVTTAVLIYVGLRLAITAVLALLGHSTPDLPLAVLGLCVADLRWRHPVVRMLASAATVAALAWVAAISGVSSVAAGPLAVIAAVTVAAWGATALGQRLRRPATALLLVTLGLSAAVALQPRPAGAHDPGQGKTLRPVHAVAVSDGRGRLSLAVQAEQPCGRLDPVAVVARRGGDTRTAPLTADGPCRFQGALQVPADGRWFLYATLRQDGAPAETWVPITSDHTAQFDGPRTLYRPAGRSTASTGQYLAGAGLYLIGVLLLCAAVTLVSRRTGRAPALREVRNAGGQ